MPKVLGSGTIEGSLKTGCSRMFQSQRWPSHLCLGWEPLCPGSWHFHRAKKIPWRNPGIEKQRQHMDFTNGNTETPPACLKSATLLSGIDWYHAWHTKQYLNHEMTITTPCTHLPRLEDRPGVCPARQCHGEKKQSCRRFCLVKSFKG